MLPWSSFWDFVHREALLYILCVRMGVISETSSSHEDTGRMKTFVDVISARTVKVTPVLLFILIYQIIGVSTRFVDAS